MDWFNLCVIVLVIVIIVAIYNRRQQQQVNNDQAPAGVIQALLRQSARWALAAQQDQSPFVAILHANYAAGYLWALKDIASSEQVRAATGVDLLAFERKITATQDAASQTAIGVCPGLRGAETDIFLAAIAGE